MEYFIQCCGISLCEETQLLGLAGQISMGLPTGGMIPTGLMGFLRVVTIMGAFPVVMNL